MRVLRVALVVAAGVVLSGCSALERVESFFRPNPYSVAPAENISISYALVDAIVDIPPGLSVSEANAYYPFADIVWRGDPPGNRHAQIARLPDCSQMRSNLPSLGWQVRFLSCSRLPS